MHMDHEYKDPFFMGQDVGQDLLRERGMRFSLRKTGAGDGIRTRNPQLGKLMRYRCATPAQVERKKIN